MVKVRICNAVLVFQFGSPLQADFLSTSDRNVELNDMSVTLLTSLFVLEFTFCTNTQIISRVPSLSLTTDTLLDFAFSI